MRKPFAVACALVAGCLVGDPEEEVFEDENPDVDLGDDDTAVLAAGCSSTTSVILYSESTNAFTLPQAFAASADACTQYYVYLPAVTDASGEKTEVRQVADKVHLLGPNFHAMAEFHWGAWRNWVAASPGTRTFELAGKAFRNRMAAGGFGAGDIWAINEFPSTTRTGEFDVWVHERAAVKGLGEGDGTLVKGLVFDIGTSQAQINFSVYKANLENWLQQDGYWSTMASYVRFWAQETYADPHFNCVTGSNVLADAEHVNTFLHHLPQLAVAGGSRTATAAAYLKRHYLPLLGSAWNATIGFGDNRIGIADFEKFQRLQIFATHYWAAHHGYPGRRIGFAWAPKEVTADQETAIAQVIARSTTRAYPKNEFWNKGKLACAIDGSLTGCGCTVAGSYNNGWNTFTTW